MLRCMGCMAEIPDESNFCPLCGYGKDTPAREAYHLDPGTILQGRYIVGKVLGYGGFGVTYIGFDAALERIVAIKEFLPSTFATRIPGDTAVTVYEGNATEQFGAGLTRFVEEAQTLAQFNGIPGIVDIYDSFAGNNTAYIVMQYLKGRDVKAVLSAGGPMPYEDSRDIILKVCDTLAPVHAKGIIHRDISPDNIFLTEEGEVKLLDFGAARYESAMNSKSLSVILKSGYAPEEQYRSRGEQGSWTDVYALAATFYKMLTGQTPQDSMERAIQDELKEPSKLGAQLPESTENAILNALCVRKTDRTQTALDFKNAILSDGVQRVKVKKTAGANSRVPLGARIAIAASAGILVLLGLFTASGGFGEGSVIGGTKLEDNYGAASKEGYVALPSVVGMNLAEAQTTLEELGLVLEIKSSVFTKTERTDAQVTRQEPVGGKQVEAGSTVQVEVDMGSYLSAVASGRAPSMVGMTASEAYSFTRNNGFHDIGTDFRYVYSGDENIGRVVDVTLYEYPNDPGYFSYRVNVGAGQDNAPPPYGSLRGVYLEESYIRYAVASSAYYDYETYEESPDLPRVNHRLLVSSDGGASWMILRDDYGSSDRGYSRSEDEIAENLPYRGSIGIDDRLTMRYPELAGKELRLRLERYYEENDEILDYADLAETFRFDYVGEPVQIDSIDTFTPEEAQTLYDEGRFGEDNYEATRYFEPEDEMTTEELQNMRENYVFLRITGNFTASRDSYRLYWSQSSDGSMDSSYALCTQDGELLVVVPRGYSYQEETDPVMLYVLNSYSGSDERTIDLMGNYSRTLSQPAAVPMPPGWYWQDK